MEQDKSEQITWRVGESNLFFKGSHCIILYSDPNTTSYVRSSQIPLLSGLLAGQTMDGEQHTAVHALGLEDSQ